MEAINWETLPHTIFFLIFASVACVFAVAVVVSSNIVRMAFYLVVSLGAVAGLFFLAGADFATLAQAHSTDTSTRLAGGDLGWFPMGTLTMPDVEEAAFALEPGEVSQPIESLLGFHIVKCNERGEHPLSPHALQRQREAAVVDWLNGQRDTVAIEIFITP